MEHISQWILSFEGTPAGARAALLLALSAAFLHALFGALQKGRHDPWISRAAIDLSYGLMALPVALFLVPWPRGGEWWIFLGVFIVHAAYKLAQASAYSAGAFTFVYPIMRGTSPLVTMFVASLVFVERYGPRQWLGVLLLSGGIFLLSLVNLRSIAPSGKPPLRAVLLALLTGLTIAGYTTYDAWGIRTLPDPMTFLAWFFVVDSMFLPALVILRRHRHPLPDDMAPLVLRGIVGGLVAFVSFGAIMLATRLDKVGEAAALRETSALFAALIGWLLLKEEVEGRRLLFMAMIATGAVLIELG